ncbi:hypothetical protein DDB_G0271054 [Dictyostelium discoideum AX4]|uniref:FHA domain-containing protein n=1 Tax=Dictyostelium discoideum TaxID=44689 RepID=Q55C08_DICDI|nr:hypothetical protein DDB_G0271054 [Dictyostelium discoideum AX4]EAL72877.1 hypothetical protein DDB_G0271054 [Dictyostelium discoideum AX4]|eukprot:XP_646673.1 hypothetical protein DDB_G0271054 [Dictyostelium discoideum AX4]
MSENNEGNIKNGDDDKMMPPPPSNFLMPPPPSTLIKKSPNKQPQQPQQPQPKVELIYKEPEWSKSNPDIEYKFEVIKSGTIIEHINLNKKPFYLIGRLPICDIQLEHATISRQHAIIQHRDGGKLYLYDLNSTHGSMINKQKCKPNIHIPIKVGDVIKFGESTRLFVLDGPNLNLNYNDDDNINNDEKEKEKIKEKERAKEKAAFLSLFTSNNSSSNSDNKPLINRDVWLKDDHDEEIRNHYKEQDDDNKDLENNNNNKNNKKRNQNKNDDDDDYDEDDLDNSNNKRKKKSQEDDDDDDDEDNQFYDRTNQSKDKLQKQQQLKLNDQSITELIEKRKQFEIEKLSLQKQFKQSTLLNKNNNNDNDEEDELDKFMNENEQELKKNTQQKIMNSLITIEDQIKKLESILFLKPDYKKYSQSLQSSLKSIQLNDGIDKSIENKTTVITTTTPAPTTTLTNSTIKSTENKLMFNDDTENKIQENNNNKNNNPNNNNPNNNNNNNNNNNKNNNNNNNNDNNKLGNLLENDIPEEYKVKQNQKPKKVYTPEEKIKKLKEKQESEYVNLISRENNDGDESNRYGY